MKKTKEAARDRMIAQFPEASKEEIAIASRKTVRCFSTDGKGTTKEMPIKPKDGYFRTRSEGGIATFAKRRNIKLKSEVWTGQTLLNFFRQELITANTTTRWFIMLNDPARKLTNDDQICLMLAHSETEFMVQINLQDRHLVIENLTGIAF